MHLLLVLRHDLKVQSLANAVRAPRRKEDKYNQQNKPKNEPAQAHTRRRGCHPDCARCASVGVVEPCPITLICRVQYHRRVVHVP